MVFGRRIVRRFSIGCGSLVLVLAGLVIFTKPGQDLRTLVSHGFLDAYLSDGENRKYHGNTEANLKAMYAAIMQYHESEGQFPKSEGWMDALKNYGAASDLAKGETEKKFMSPSLHGQANEFGYAMNDLASGKYKGDIKDPKTPLIFDSSNTSRNAHGDPKKLLPSPPREGGNLGIAVDGTILKL